MPFSWFLTKLILFSVDSRKKNRSWLHGSEEWTRGIWASLGSTPPSPCVHVERLRSERWWLTFENFELCHCPLAHTPMLAPGATDLSQLGRGHLGMDAEVMFRGEEEPRSHALGSVEQVLLGTCQGLDLAAGSSVSLAEQGSEVCAPWLGWNWSSWRKCTC
jgi:hypothetical protein